MAEVAVVANHLCRHRHTGQVLLVVGKSHPGLVVGENQPGLIVEEHIVLDIGLVVKELVRLDGLKDIVVDLQARLGGLDCLIVEADGNPSNGRCPATYFYSSTSGLVGKLLYDH